MVNFIKFFVFFLFLFVSSISYGVEWLQEKHSKLRIIGGSSGGKEYLALNIKLDEEWHIYWRNPGDIGIATSIKPVAPDVVINEMYWPAPIVKTEFGEMHSNIYNNEVAIIFTVDDIIPPAEFFVDYAICKHICVPVSVEVRYNGGRDDQTIKKYLARVPKQNGTNGLKIESVNLMDKLVEVKISALAPLISPMLIAEAKGVTFRVEDFKLDKKNRFSGIFHLKHKHDYEDIKNHEIYLTLVNNNQDAIEGGFQINAAEEPVTPSVTKSLLVIMLLALSGGLILNFMPCVLPVLSMKLLSIVSKSNMGLGKIRKSFIASSLGIIFSFMALGALMCFLISTGRAVGLGLHFQQPSFIIFIILVLVFFACNLLSFFEINLPGLNRFIFYKEGFIGDFLNGAFATLLATPCSAPLVGTAIAFALSQGSATTMFIFTTMGVGLAMPYLLLATFPEMISLMPKPGAWMNKLKYFLAMLLALTIIWMLVVLSGQLGPTASLLLFLLCILIKFALATKTSFLRNKNTKIFVVLLLVILAFFIPEHNSYNEKKYDNYVTGIWHPFAEDKIAGLVRSGKVVVVDVTAEWCLTCKFNKMLTLNRVDVLNYLKHHNVVAMRADITNPSPHVSSYMKNLNRYGIPLNVIYGPNAPEGIILSEILTSSKLINAIKKAGLADR